MPEPKKPWNNRRSELRYKKTGTHPTALRKKVFARDAGICAICRVDCVALSVAMKWFRRLSTKSGFTLRLLEQWLVSVGLRGRVSLWDADHIVRVEDGGRDELSNVRTLCFWCHKTVGEISLDEARRRCRGGNGEKDAQQGSLFDLNDLLRMLVAASDKEADEKPPGSNFD